MVPKSKFFGLTTIAGDIESLIYGTWRSLEAHLNGVQGVGGSNPLVPTMKSRGYGSFTVAPFFVFVGDQDRDCSARPNLLHTPGRTASCRLWA